MRTTLDLDRKLLEKAKETLGARSFTEAIETALKEAVARADARRGWDELTGASLSWESADELRRFRDRFGGRPL